MAMQVLTTEVVRALIYAGYTWRLEWFVSLAAGATAYMGFTTSDAGALVLDRRLNTDGDNSYFRFYRNTSYSGGVALTPQQRNDRFWTVNGTRTAVSSAATGVTATPAAADLMSTIRLHTQQQKVATLSEDTNMLVLAPNTPYVLAVTNASTNACEDWVSFILARDQCSTGVVRLEA